MRPVLLAFALCFPFLVEAQTPPPRDGVADALAGHQAELRQADPEKDRLRRALFFDPVDVESSPAGVPCDHLAARRPEVVAGTGEVFLFETATTPHRRLRYWAPPGGPEDALADAEAFARASGGAARLVARRRFAWCR